MSLENTKIIDGVVVLKEFDDASLPNPEENSLYLFADDSSGTTVIKYKTSNGVETTLGSGGGGSSATYVRTTLANGANTIASPGGSPANGDVRIYLLKQPASGAAGTITFDAIFVFPDGYVPNVSTTNGRTDWFEATYDSVSAKWVATKFIGGFAL